MNPFLTLLAVLPLIGAGFLLIVFVINVLTQGPSWGNLVPIIIFTSIVLYLLRFLRKVSAPDGVLIDLAPELNQNPDAQELQRWFTKSMIIIVYLVLGAGAIYILNQGAFKNWIGGVCFLLGLCWIYAGIADYYTGLKALASLRTLSQGSEVLNSIAARHRIARNIFLLNPILAASLFIAYAYLGVFTEFTIVDLSGVAFFLLSLTVWGLLRDCALQQLKKNVGQPGV